MNGGLCWIGGLAFALPLLNAADRPDVVFILSDNHSYYEYGFHGSEQVRTPNIDDLAAQSLEFTNWHTEAYCSPGHASLLTGINSMRHGIYHTIAGRCMLPDEAVTIAELLGGEGYATGIIGNWHLGDSYPFRPQDQGFATTFCNEGLSLANATTDPSKIRKDVTFSRDGKPSPSEGYCTDQKSRPTLKHQDNSAVLGKLPARSEWPGTTGSVQVAVVV